MSDEKDVRDRGGREQNIAKKKKHNGRGVNRLHPQRRKRMTALGGRRAKGLDETQHPHRNLKKRELSIRHHSPTLRDKPGKRNDSPKRMVRLEEEGGRFQHQTR